MIAALYVEKNGPYFGLSDVDPWDSDRNARKYRGPFPIVAHPPCERWGRYWSGGPSAKVRRKLGDDNGCFANALFDVIKYGGVIEHPEGSHAFKYFLLGTPKKSGGWEDSIFGWICCVEQGHYGHRARKATWLLYVGDTKPPELIWGPSRGDKIDEGFHSNEERSRARNNGLKPLKRLSKKERTQTPIPFRNLLIELVENSRKDAGRLGSTA